MEILARAYHFCGSLGGAWHTNPNILTYQLTMPDYELTAIECVQQYKFCIGQDPDWCTSWGEGRYNFEATTKVLLQAGDRDSVAGIDTLHIHPIFDSPVSRYLYYRKQLAIVGLKYGLNFDRFDHKDQWIVELKAWFEATLLQSRYMIASILPENPGRNLNGWPHSHTIGDPCPRALFYDTN